MKSLFFLLLAACLFASCNAPTQYQYIEERVETLPDGKEKVSYDKPFLILATDDTIAYREAFTRFYTSQKAFEGLEASGGTTKVISFKLLSEDDVDVAIFLPAGYKNSIKTDVVYQLTPPKARQAIAEAPKEPIKRQEYAPAEPAKRRAYSESQFEDYFSKWDGSCPALVREVKKKMHDPESFEHVETKAYFKDGEMILVMSYRAKNGFNAVRLGNVAAKLSVDGAVSEVAFQE